MIHTDRRAYFIASLTALVAWGVGLATTSSTEGWDSRLYWMLGYPAMFFVSFLCGRSRRTRAWRWPLTMAAVQLALMFLGNPDPAYFPLGIAATGFFCSPLLVAAYLGAFSRRSPAPA